MYKLHLIHNILWFYRLNFSLKVSWLAPVFSAEMNKPAQPEAWDLWQAAGWDGLRGFREETKRFNWNSAFTCVVSFPFCLNMIQTCRTSSFISGIQIATLIPLSVSFHSKGFGATFNPTALIEDSRVKVHRNLIPIPWDSLFWGTCLI